MKHLTNDQHNLIAAIRAAVEDKGDNYFYNQAEAGNSGNSCTYLNWNTRGDDGHCTEASCLIGQGLLNSGLVTTDFLESHEGNAAHAVVPEVPNVEGFDDSDFYWAINSAQSAQDGGKTWGQAWFVMLLNLAVAGFDISRYHS